MPIRFSNPIEVVCLVITQTIVDFMQSIFKTIKKEMI
jgi:hypothetical protein